MSGLELGILGFSIVMGVMTFLFIFRIVLTWYPQADLTKFPFNLVAGPTEPLLVVTRKIIQPIGGVDITPIVWVGLFSLAREILLGQQGLITMAMRSNPVS
ncbi:MAG: YggT family protein [Cyanobacteria bacterium]|nr:YggT family protein [Cyanobacteriota bacterium]